MPPLFRKRQSAATLPADETIPDDLLAAIPDVGGKAAAETPVPFVDVTPVDDDDPIALPESWNPADILARRAMREEAAKPPEPPRDEDKKKGSRDDKKARTDEKKPPRAEEADMPPLAVPDMGALVQDVRRQMESVFSRELGKVEDSFTATLRDLQARLDRATTEADGLRRENESLLRLKAEYDRKAEALRELARSFEKS